MLTCHTARTQHRVRGPLRRAYLDRLRRAMVRRFYGSRLDGSLRLSPSCLARAWPTPSDSARRRVRPASTRAFLDRAIFPRLTHLISYEDSQVWCDRLRQELPTDPRWQLRQITAGNYGAEAPFLAGFNLAFVDTGNADSRVLLVGHILRGIAPIVVLHDYDGPQTYRDAANRWAHRVVYTKVSPQTAVVSAQPLPPAVHEALR